MKTRKTYLFSCVILYCVMISYIGSSDVAAQPRKAATPKLQPTSSVSSVLTTKVLQAEDMPVRLLIPAIQVDALIERVGVVASGELDTPRQSPWTNVGWYNASPDPGSDGSSVIDGHLDRPGGLPAVFWNLRNLHAGDQLKVIHQSGKISVFIITSTASYPVNEVPLEAVFGNGGGRYLNLITCAGDWIRSQHQTTSRMVVYAMLAQ
jgi:sortase (surface protein transpeptidase)